MLVKDLIKKLQKLPQDINVCFLDDSYKLDGVMANIENKELKKMLIKWSKKNKTKKLLYEYMMDHYKYGTYQKER